MKITEWQFQQRLGILEKFRGKIKSVTGPGRSGVISAVYASYYLKVPFIPIDQVRVQHKPILIVDTAVQTGKTLRKARAKIKEFSYICAFFEEPPSLTFWYENCINTKPLKVIKMPRDLGQYLRLICLPMVFICEYVWKITKNS